MSALIGAAGAGLIGAAIFPTDPVSGYLPGTPDVLPAPVTAGVISAVWVVSGDLGLLRQLDAARLA